MLNLDAPDHPRLRRVVTKVFTPRLLRTFEPDMVAAAKTVIGAIRERGTCDFAVDMANRMPMKVICDMLSVPEGDDRDELARLTWQAPGYGDEAIDDATDALGAFYALNAFGEELGRRRPGEDLLSMMVAPISMAGSIAQGIRFLAEHSARWQAWRADYEGLAATALEEIVRFASPEVRFGRRFAHDTEIAGQLIAEREQVVFWYISANCDEAVFDMPERFDIRRIPNDHFGYGVGGPRHCRSMHLAHQEMYHFFKTLFTILPDLEISTGCNRSMASS